MFVLDGGLRPVPVGVAGELYIAGDGVAAWVSGAGGVDRGSVRGVSVRGWGERMYRTGDVVRWAAEGELVYRGARR